LTNSCILLLFPVLLLYLQFRLFTQSKAWSSTQLQNVAFSNRSQDGTRSRALLITFWRSLVRWVFCSNYYWTYCWPSCCNLVHFRPYLSAIFTYLQVDHLSLEPFPFHC